MFAIAVLVTVILWSGLTVWITWGFIHPERIHLTGKPDDRYLPCEEVRFPSAGDHLELRGWVVRPEGTPRGIVILCHGRVSNRAAMIPQARFLCRAGFACLMFDFRCSGESSGDTSTLGWQEKDDVLGAVAYLKSRADTHVLPIGALGVSMGGAAVLLAAAHSPEIRAVVADCSYAVFPRAIDQRFRAFLGPIHPLFSVPVRFWGERLLGMDAATVSPLEAVRTMGDRPLLLIHGTADLAILPEDSELLYAAASGPKELWKVPGGWHVGCYFTAPDEYARRVTAFFDKIAVGSQR